MVLIVGLFSSGNWSGGRNECGDKAGKCTHQEACVGELQLSTKHSSKDLTGMLTVPVFKYAIIQGNWRAKVISYLDTNLGKYISFKIETS